MGFPVATEPWDRSGHSLKISASEMMRRAHASAAVLVTVLRSAMDL